MDYAFKSMILSQHRRIHHKCSHIIHSTQEPAREIHIHCAVAALLRAPQQDRESQQCLVLHHVPPDESKGSPGSHFCSLITFPNGMGPALREEHDW